MCSPARRGRFPHRCGGRESWVTGFAREDRAIRVLVTGAAGFIGSTLVAALLARGDSVVGIDSLTDYYDPQLKRRNLAEVRGAGFEFVEGDLNEMDLPALLGGGFQAIVHLAGQPGVRKSWGDDFTAYSRGNVDATQRLLEAALHASPGSRFVYASSSSVYGQAETYPTTEGMLPRPHSPYGVTKLAGEHLVGLYGENFGLTTTAFRFFTVYGPRQRPDMAFTRFLTAAREGAPISVYGTGEQVRDFTFVEDIVSALVAAVNSREPLPPVMNLSGGSSVSVNEVLEAIAEIAGRPLDIQRSESMRGDVFRTGGDSSLARTALGWRPVTPLVQGLQRQWEWINSR